MLRSAGGEPEVTLYHHHDGYPTNMLPLLKRAWDEALAWHKARWKTDLYGPFDPEHPITCASLRSPGKFANHVVATDPEGFEFEQGHEQHGDIEWYYVVEFDHAPTFSGPVEGRWKVQVDKLCCADGAVVYSTSGTFQEVAEAAKEIEAVGRAAEARKHGEST